MEDWKFRQDLYHRLNKNHSDDLGTQVITFVDSEEIVKNAIRYFSETNIGWVYPSKSYMVGICYARWLAEHFGGRPLEYLEDPDLLFGNDPHFVQYSTDPLRYHQILNDIGGWEFDQQMGMVPDVREYFNQEFMIEQI